MKLPPDVNLLACRYYLQALDYQRNALPGGGDPRRRRRRTSRTWPLAGCQRDQPRQPGHAQHGEAVPVEGPPGGGRPFVQQVYFPDVARARGALSRSGRATAPVSKTTLRCRICRSTPGTNFDLPGGTIFGRHLADAMKPITGFGDAYFRDGVTESSSTPTTPATVPATRGRARRSRTTPAIGSRDGRKYTWVKAPRFDGKPMQVARWRRSLSVRQRRPAHHPKLRDRHAQDGRAVAKTPLGARHPRVDARPPSPPAPSARR